VHAPARQPMFALSTRCSGGGAAVAGRAVQGVELALTIPLRLALSPAASSGEHLGGADGPEGAGREVVRAARGARRGLGRARRRGGRRGRHAQVHRAQRARRPALRLRAGGSAQCAEVARARRRAAQAPPLCISAPVARVQHACARQKVTLLLALFPVQSEGVLHRAALQARP